MRADAIQILEKTVEKKFNRKADLFTSNSYFNLCEIEKLTASEAMSSDIEWLGSDRRHRLILILDPNGPKYLPFHQIMQLLNGPLRTQVDVIIHISGGAIKRVLGWAPAQKGMLDWFGRFETIFVSALSAEAEAWIREPIPGDSSQWTMMVYWAKPIPQGDWQKQGFVKLGTPRGSAATAYYTSGRNERTG